MGKLRSGRVKRTPQTGITSDRYEFLGLKQAEPNLGDPTVGPSSTSVNPIKIGTVYQLVSVNQNPGERFWMPVSGIGTEVGAITVYSNGEIATPNYFNTIHGLNFVGSGVTVIGPSVGGPFPGVGIATINIGVGVGESVFLNQGEVNEILYNSPSGYVDGASDFYYLNNNVGIGSTIPTVKLDVIGDARISGILTISSLNVSGITTLQSNVSHLAGIKQKRKTVTGISSVYTINIKEGNSFKLDGDVSGDISINLGELDWLDVEEEWEGKLIFKYQSGTISWFPSNVGVGYSVKWNSNAQISPTAGETETIFIVAIGGTTTIDVAYLQGRL